MKTSILTILFLCLFVTGVTFGQKKLEVSYDRFTDVSVVTTGWMRVKGGAFSKEAWLEDMQFQLDFAAVFGHPGQTITENTDIDKLGARFVLDLSAGEKRIGRDDKLYVIVDGKRIVLDPIFPTENKVNVNEQVGEAFINAMGNNATVAPSTVGKIAAEMSVSLSQTAVFGINGEDLATIANGQQIEMKIGDVEFKIKKDNLQKLKQFHQYIVKSLEPLEAKLQVRKAERNNQTIKISEQKQSVSNNADVAKSYNATALTYFQKGQYQEAYDAFNKAVIADPQNGMYHYNLASALTALRKFNEAEKEMLEAIKIEPENSTYKTGLDAVRQNIKNSR